MPDFREQLYKKYHSTFKTYLSTFDEKVIKNEWRWYKFKYLPLLKNFSRNASILELGCGQGIMMEFLKNHGFENVKGIDISKEQIRYASSKGLDVEVIDAQQFFRINKNTYDIIIALDFVEHFSKDELLQLFESVFTCLNKDGLFIIHTPNGQALFPGRMIYGDLTHLTILNPYSAKQILKYVGFEKIDFYEKGPISKNIKGIIRLSLWKIVKLFYNLILVIETGNKEKILTQNFICAARK